MIRLRITPHFEGDAVRFTLDWVEIGEGEQIVGVVATEEFALAAHREGCAYVTRGGFETGQMQPGTFWVDEKGSRHFVMNAEPGHVGLFGGEAQAATE